MKPHKQQSWRDSLKPQVRPHLPQLQRNTPQLLQVRPHESPWAQVGRQKTKKALQDHRLEEGRRRRRGRLAWAPSGMAKVNADDAEAKASRKQGLSA